MTMFNDISTFWSRLFHKNDYVVPVVSSVGVGAKGDKGDTGPIGPIGPQGVQGPMGLTGAKGDKGDPFVYSDFTEQQLKDLQEFVGKAYYVKNEAVFTTSSSSTSTINLSSLTGLNYSPGDMLLIDVEGLNLIQGVDYSISNSTVTFTSPITHSGTKIHFVAMRSAVVDESYTIKGDKGDKGDPGEIAGFRLAVYHAVSQNATIHPGAVYLFDLTYERTTTMADVTISGAIEPNVNDLLCIYDFYTYATRDGSTGIDHWNILASPLFGYFKTYKKLPVLNAGEEDSVVQSVMVAFLIAE